jgi:Tfp pilus assembly protein PilN
MVIVLGGASVYFWYDRGLSADQVAAKQTEKAELTLAIEKTKEEQLELAYILDRQTLYKSLSGKSIAFQQAIDKISQATPANLRITNITLKATKDVALSGYAQTRADIAAFTEHLSQSTVFSDVTLNQTDNQADGVHYSVTLKVIESAPAKSSPSPTAKPASTPGGQP